MVIGINTISIVMEAGPGLSNGHNLSVRSQEMSRDGSVCGFDSQKKEEKSNFPFCQTP